MNNYIKVLAFFYIYIIFSDAAQANVPNILGTYTGTETDTSVSCTNSFDNGVVTSSLTLLVDNLDGSSFSGTNGNGEDTFTGTIDSAGNVSGSYALSDGERGTFAGTVVGTEWKTSSRVVTAGASGCLGNGTQTLKGSGTTGSLASAQVQQSRQIVRTTNTIISQHLSTQVSNAFYQEPLDSFQGVKSGASSDGEAYTPDTFWGVTSISEIHEDGNNLAHFDTDIYQFVGGIDKRFGNLFLGSAFTYAYSETEQNGADSNSHVIGITPYTAYKMTDFMFVSGLVGYNYTLVSDERTGNDVDVHDYIFEGNINLYKIWVNHLITKARFGTRFHHSIMSSVGDFDDSTDELVWLGDVELGYRFDNGLIAYLGGLYEYRDREESFQGGVEHDGIAYMRGGFDYPFADRFSIGGKVQADMNDEDRDIITGSVTLRMDL